MMSNVMLRACRRANQLTVNVTFQKDSLGEPLSESWKVALSVD